MVKQVETSNGKLVTTVDHEQVYPLASQDVEELAQDTGFNQIKFYSNFAKEQFLPESSPNLICVMRGC